MKKLRILATVSSVSMIVGSYSGIKYERTRVKATSATENEVSDLDVWLKQIHRFLPTCTVMASSQPRSLSASTDVLNLSAASPAKRSTEILRYGYPGFDHIRAYENYVLSYDRRNRTAHWVFEHLKPEHVETNDETSRSKSEFIEDNTIHSFFRSTNRDYKNSGYDRGHLAAAANHRHSQRAMDETFTLANVAPQVGKGFNRDIWNSLEKHVRAIARKNRNVYVCTGPLYLPQYDNGKMMVKYEVIGQNNVAVPTHFFKILLIENNCGDYQLLSYVLPNQSLPKDSKLKNYLVPIETIERAAGLLFFDRLPKGKIKSINYKSS